MRLCERVEDRYQDSKTDRDPEVNGVTDDPDLCTAGPALPPLGVDCTMDHYRVFSGAGSNQYGGDLRQAPKPTRLGQVAAESPHRNQENCRRDHDGPPPYVGRKPGSVDKLVSGDRFTFRDAIRQSTTFCSRVRLQRSNVRQTHCQPELQRSRQNGSLKWGARVARGDLPSRVAMRWTQYVLRPTPASIASGSPRSGRLVPAGGSPVGARLAEGDREAAWPCRGRRFSRRPSR